MPTAPAVSPHGPPGAFLLELLTYNGAPFKDHWAYFLRSHISPEVGAEVRATGDVRNGFIFEVKRHHDLRETVDIPSERIPLLWVDDSLVGNGNEAALLGEDTGETLDYKPMTRLEEIMYSAKVPGKSLNDASDPAMSGRMVVQRDCQTWVVESAECLLQEGIVSGEVANYLKAVKQ